jgi:hypothetical protein
VATHTKAIDGRKQVVSKPTGTIVRQYKKGSQMEVFSQMTTYHLGWMEWRTYPHNDVNTPAQQSCFDMQVPPLQD